MFVTASGEALPITEVYEGMATALAQGCFSQQAFGKTPGTWYRDPVIDSYAHKVAKIYAEYLNEGRQIDAEFCRRVTEVFYLYFPDADRQIKWTSEYLVLQDEIPDMTKLKAQLYSAMPRMRNCAICSPVDAEESMKCYKEFKPAHMAVLISRSSLPKLSSLGLTADQIEKLKNTSRPLILQIGKKQILFCLADKPEEQQQLFFQFLKKEKWPPPQN